MRSPWLPKPRRIVSATRPRIPPRRDVENLKHRAHRLVAEAMLSGKLQKPAHCERCPGRTRFLNAHHEDYSKPLQVVWLCRSCHALAHSGWARKSSIDQHLMGRMKQ